MRETSDVARLGPLTEGELARVLRRRFVRDRIYTAAGGTLLALNPGPGRALPLYSARAARAYVAATAGDGDLEPHVYSIAAAAYRDARDGRASPLLLVTGVSGAGKTEAARLALQCVLVAGGGAGSGAGAQLAAAGTLLEAAGHAATSLNHNASRFARLIDVQLDARGGVAGGTTSHFLLEKGRVARVPPGERNFHIFYQLLAGADGALLGSLKLRGAPHEYRILSAGGAKDTPESRRAADAAHFAFTTAALHTLGVSGAREASVWRALSFVLKLGEADFTPALNIDGSLGARLLDPREVNEACELVGVDAGVLLREWGVSGNCGGGGGEEECYADEDWARAARDRLLDTVYERVFGWLVRAANEAAHSDLPARLAIVDVYGFEKLSHNGLERLLINYAAETVHLAARAAVLRGAADVARDDGAELAGVEVTDVERPGAGEVALAVLRATEGVAGCGHVALLDMAGRARDERVRPRPPHGFLVQHFAGCVEYDAHALLSEESGSETLGAGALAGARDPLLRALFAGGTSRSPRRLDSAGGRQRALVGALCRRMREGCGTRLVHCLLADEERRPRVFNEELVRHQLYTQGIVEMVAARRDGYCEWMTAGELVARYGALWRVRGAAGMSAARALLSSLPLSGAQFAFGRSLVFVRSQRTLQRLETWRTARRSRAASTLQRAWRARCARLERAARVLQARWRRRAGGAAAAARRALAAAVLCRVCVRLLRQHYLRDLWSRLPPAHVSPLWSGWPAPLHPRHTAHTDLLLRELHHRWRCCEYRTAFDQTARNRMREKVTASALFRDRKVGYSRSVGHPFVGDYVRLRVSAEWMRRGGRDGYVVFADTGGRVCRASGRVLPALLVLTTAALLVLEPRTLRTRRRLPAVDLRRLALSPADDGLLVVSGRPADSAEGCGGSAGGRGRGDLVLETRHALELATKLFLVGQNAAGRAPHVLVAPRFEADFGDQLVTVSFHMATGAPVPGGRVVPPRLVRCGSRLDVLL